MKSAAPDDTQMCAWRRAVLGIIPIAVLFAGIACSFVGYRLITDLIRHDEALSFSLLAERQTLALQRQIEKNVETVRVLGGLFDFSETVSRGEFAIFTEQLLSRVDGVRALAWTPRIPKEELNDVKRLARRQGMPEYDFFEQGADGKRQPLTERSDYIPVLYFEPFETSKGAAGFDVGSNPVRRAAADQARDIGAAASTAPLKLISSTKDEFSFLVFRPVYRSNRMPETLTERRRLIAGYTAGVFLISDILSAALGTAAPTLTRIVVFDGVGKTRSATPIFDSFASRDDRSRGIGDIAREGLVHRAQLTLPMRKWTVVITPAVSKVGSVQAFAGWMFLGAGVLVTFLVYGLLVSARMRNQVIKRQVVIRTEELEAEIAERKTIEGALKRSEQTYAKLAEMAPIGIIVFKDRQVDQANLAAADLLGAASPQDLIGRRRQDFLKPEDRDKATLRWKKVTQGRTLEAWEVETVRLDGETFPSLVRTERVAIDGNIYGIVVIEDISKAQEAELAIRESEEKYRKLIEFFPEGVLLSEQGKITQINSAGLELYGAKFESEIIGREWMSLVKESHRDNMYERRRIMAEGKSVAPVELEMLKVDGTSFWARAQAMPIHVSGQTFFMTVFADISGRKRAEQEILRTNSELVRSNEELAQFAYVASHDLKEPLRMVSSYCGLLEARYGEKLDEDGQKFIYYATDGAKRMQKLIDDLLLYSRVGRGGEAEEKVDLDAVVGDVLKVISESIRTSHATVTVGRLPVVLGFRTELSRLFQNLIGNAIKFRAEVPPIIRITCSKDDKGIRICVADNGIGIAPEFREKVFGVFQRLHGRESYEGTGIGLAVCEKIVGQMGGDIRVEATEDGGSMFVFTIPAQKVVRHAEGGEAA